ncbi:MAG: glutamate dehydrogenase, partial [Anaerolineales bacterium]|nr:glutamate dehydrogenase [Anaerolineales bacterium]
QNDYNYYWDYAEVLNRLDHKVRAAFHGVLDMARRRDVYMRDAAYMVAIDRVVKAMELRGWV